MCTFERRAYFTDNRTVDVIRAELLRTASAYDVEVIAYCFMPDHLHVVIEGMTENADLLKFTAMFRQRSGHRYRQLHNGYLWQEGYVDRSLRKDEATLDVVTYIVANPLRAGLCRDVREYPFVGSSRYSLEEMIDSLA